MRFKNSVLERVKRSFWGRLKTIKTKNRSRLKILYQRLSNFKAPDKFIFIFGCQRSGTTLLERIFRHDYRSVVFGEFSDLSIDMNRTVWKPLSEIERQFHSCKALYVVARSLYESHRAGEVLEFFPGSITVWLYRDYNAVVDSMKNKWKDKFFDVSKINESNKENKWALETMVNSLKKEAVRQAENSVAIDDLYALYWLKRNNLFFEQNLESNENVICIRYSSLITFPERCINQIVQKAGINLWRGFKTDAHTKSLYRKYSANISKNIQVKCDEMLDRLDQYSNI